MSVSDNPRSKFALGMPAFDDCQDLGDYSVGVIHNALPGEPQHHPASDDQFVLTRSVLLERAAIRVEGSAVYLNGDLQLGTGEVNFSENLPALASNGVVGGPVEARALQQTAHALFGLRA